MTVYLDTSAIIKLVVVERESAALVDWLNDRSEQTAVTSQLSEVEVPRALRRAHPDRVVAGERVLAGLTRLAISADVRADAGAFADPQLRSFDAVHLASAGQLVKSGKRVPSVVTYDVRMGQAADELGLVVASPGG